MEKHFERAKLKASVYKLLLDGVVTVSVSVPGVEGVTGADGANCAMSYTKIGFIIIWRFARQLTNVYWSDFRMISRSAYTTKFNFWNLFYLNTTFQWYLPCKCSVCFLTNISLSELVFILVFLIWAFRGAKFGLNRFNWKQNWD